MFSQTTKIMQVFQVKRLKQNYFQGNYKDSTEIIFLVLIKNGQGKLQYWENENAYLRILLSDMGTLSPKLREHQYKYLELNQIFHINPPLPLNSSELFIYHLPRCPTKKIQNKISKLMSGIGVRFLVHSN